MKSRSSEVISEVKIIWHELERNSDDSVKGISIVLCIGMLTIIAVNHVGDKILDTEEVLKL